MSAQKLHMRLAPWQAAAIFSPFEHTALFGGVASGKSFTGSQFSIQHFTQMPDLTGFIGANTYDQLSQATLRETFYWLDHHRIPYVIHKQPPRDWYSRKAKKRTEFPSYRNILSVKVGPQVAHAFTRVLSNSDVLRGIEFSWYHVDETRDTPVDTHDVILSRMRQSKYRRGLLTTTTNGEDWGYQRFACARRGQRLYGSIHVRTEEAVKHGIITREYYELLKQTYSELLALQELEALHVNVHGGRAYYAFNEYNRRRVAPWGDAYPNPMRPLIVGCDFNFDPAPHVWMVGQTGPEMFGPNGEWWPEHVHWFGELSRSRASTPTMAQALVMQYGTDFFYRIFGDRSGARATTSNAGKPDYDQIAAVLEDMGCEFTIDTDQGNNPLVRNRVENMNRLANDATGKRRQTYNPDLCPLFDSDVKMVGWKLTNQKGQGKLDNGGNVKLTHATDGAGYAVWKILPPSRRGRLMPGTPSMASQELGSWRRG